MVHAYGKCFIPARQAHRRLPLKLVHVERALCDSEALGRRQECCHVSLDEATPGGVDHVAVRHIELKHAQNDFVAREPHTGQRGPEGAGGEVIDRPAPGGIRCVGDAEQEPRTARGRVGGGGHPPPVQLVIDNLRRACSANAEEIRIAKL